MSDSHAEEYKDRQAFQVSDCRQSHLATRRPHTPSSATVLGTIFYRKANTLPSAFITVAVLCHTPFSARIQRKSLCFIREKCSGTSYRDMVVFQGILFPYPSWPVLKS